MTSGLSGGTSSPGFKPGTQELGVVIVHVGELRLDAGLDHVSDLLLFEVDLSMSKTIRSILEDEREQSVFGQVFSKD